MWYLLWIHIYYNFYYIHMNPDLDEKEMIGDLLDDYGMVF